MNEQNHTQIADRRRLFKLFDKGKRPRQILQLIPRSRSWLYKWKQRFEQDGGAALDACQKAPRHSPQQYDREVVALVLRIRQRLARAPVGLVGARAIRRELKHRHALKRVPTLATINRWLKAAGLLDQPAPEPKPAYYPAPQWRAVGGPTMQAGLVCHACDWTQRYLPGGVKVFAFHTVDLRTHALWQTIGRDKTTATVQSHALEVWQQLGLPDFLQLDNDAAFTGLGRKARVFGAFVRLALSLGIELIFIPPAEAKRNWLVEGVNHLWAASFWDKNDFTSWRDFARKRGKFLTWYEDYEPPALGGLSIRQARASVGKLGNKGGRRLTRREVIALPPLAELPLTAGRIHFLRRVAASGEIELLKERWKVSKRLAHQYVWATIHTGRQSLEIYHRPSARAQPRLVKRYDYEIGERVCAVAPRYRRQRRAISVLKLM